MISVDKVKCKKCGICISLMEGYCITGKEGYPVFDFSICNLCKKCVAVCPYQAIMINNIHPEKIKDYREDFKEISEYVLVDCAAGLGAEAIGTMRSSNRHRRNIYMRTHTYLKKLELTYSEFKQRVPRLAESNL